MEEKAMECIRCPDCKGHLDLEVDEKDGDRVIVGRLVCKNCKEEFKIEKGIPRLLTLFSSSSFSS